jgi:hypothetical protein
MAQGLFRNSCGLIYASIRATICRYHLKSYGEQGMQINMDYIRAQLQRRAGERQTAKVSRMAGVGINTIRRIIEGNACRLSIAGRLQPFLEKHEKVRKLDEHGVSDGAQG